VASARLSRGNNTLRFSPTQRPWRYLAVQFFLFCKYDFSFTESLGGRDCGFWKTSAHKKTPLAPIYLRLRPLSVKLSQETAKPLHVSRFQSLLANGGAVDDGAARCRTYAGLQETPTRRAAPNGVVIDCCTRMRADLVLACCFVFPASNSKSNAHCSPRRAAVGCVCICGALY